VVKTVAEIHRARRPRLVKLHGSLPNHSPLIVTEEDFRRYPADFAPFVNLAQQVLMENVLCLIGFSGDDPNFLYWSGWVRDHLGKWAPPIYLAGWLALSAPQRRLLESRQVNPIDLAHLPFRQGTSEDLQRREALHWFLLNLKLGEPYRSADWPSPPSRSVIIPGRLPFSSLSALSPSGPRSEVALPRLAGDPPSPEQLLAAVRELTAVWREQRAVYPGWVIAPSGTRGMVSGVPEFRHIEIMEGLRLAPPVEALSMLRELVRRYAIALTPLPPDIVTRIDAVLEAVDPTLGVLRGPDATALPPGINSEDLRTAWGELAVERLRSAREQDDADQFNTWVDRLAPHLQDNLELAARVRYERCLYALSRLDLHHVAESVERWQTQDLDPLWTLRKAGLLAELGMTEEAYDTARRGLEQIRRRARRDQPDIASLSRESWTLFFLEQFRILRYRRRRLAEGLPEMASPQELAAESRGDAPSQPLAANDAGESLEAQRPRFSPHRCDPVDEFSTAWSDISGKIPRPPEDATTRWEFDQGHITRSQHFRFGRQSLGNLLAPAYRARRLVEDAGLPTVADKTNISAFLLTRVAEWLLGSDPIAARALLLRSTSEIGADAFEATFSRCRIALLTPQEVARLLDLSRQAVAQGERTIRDLAAQDRDRYRAALRQTTIGVEVASRLAVRQEPDQARGLLSWALQLTRSKAFQQDRHLGQQLTPLFRRIIDTLGPDLSTADALTLFSQPLPGVAGFDPLERNTWPEVANLLKFHPPLDPPPMSSPERQATVDHLVHTASQAQPALRTRALARLQLLDAWNWLTSDERGQLAGALWRPPVDQDGWPIDTGLEPWEFATLPEPQPGAAAGKFHATFLAPQGRQFEAPVSSSFLGNLVRATVPAPWKAGWLELSAAEADRIARKLVAWWQTGQAQAAIVPHPFMPTFDLEEFQRDLVWTLADVVMPALSAAADQQTPVSSGDLVAVQPALPLPQQLLQMIDDLQRLRYPVELAFVELVRLCPEHSDELTGRLRRGLASLEERSAEAAVEAVLRWWNRARAGRLSAPPEDLLRELALIVSVRRPSNLHAALRATAWIVSGKTLPGIDPHSLALSDTFVELLVEGLDYLAGAATYGQILPLTGPEAAKKSYEIVEQRELCVALARALAANGRADSRPVRRWLEEAATDPLPDVRMAEVI
jgi:SIR2-like domain